MEFQITTGCWRAEDRIGQRDQGSRSGACAPASPWRKSWQSWPRRRFKGVLQHLCGVAGRQEPPDDELIGKPW